MCIILIYRRLLQGKYEDSVRMYRRGFEIAQDLAVVETIETTRVDYGIGLAHTLLTGYSECMDQVNKSNMQRLLDFKRSRWNTFSEEDEDNGGTAYRISQQNSIVGSQTKDNDLPCEEGNMDVAGEVSDEAAVDQNGKQEKVNGGSDSGVTSEGEDVRNGQTET